MKMNAASLPTPITSPHHKSIMHLPKVPSFCNLPEKQEISPSTPTPKKKLPVSLQYISKFIILERMLKDMDGRDKSMKIIQYIIKILLYHNVASSKRWTALATQFSVTRQVLQLGNASSDIRELLSTNINKRQALQTLLLVNSISNAISDDVYCLYRIGILPKKWGQYSEIISAHCWFISIIYGLRTNYIKMCRMEANMDNEKNNVQDLKLAQVAVLKSIADLAFCGCDVFHPSFSKGLQAWLGFFSGVLAGYKVYVKVNK